MNCKPFLSVSYVHALLETLDNMGIDTTSALINSNIMEAELKMENCLVQYSCIEQLFSSCVKLTGMSEEYLSYLIGTKTNFNALGSFGLAMFSEETVEKALDVVISYSSIICSAFEWKMSVKKKNVHLKLVRKMDLPPKALKLCLCLLLGNSLAIVKTVLGNTAEEVKYFSNIILCIPAEGFDFFIEGDLYSGMVTNYNSPEFSVSFPEDILRLKLPFSNRMEAKKNRARCEELKSNSHISIVAHVTNELMKAEYNFPTIEDFAKHFSVSSRTIYRQLSCEGHSYRSMLKEIKMKRAVAMFEKSNLTTNEVMNVLGYKNNSTTFVSAFKSIYEMTPAAYRNNADLLREINIS